MNKEKTINKIFYSNAKWTKIQNSQDHHSTFEAAQAVCQRLLNDYNHELAGDVRGICLEVWVTDENKRVLYENKNNK